MLRLAMRLPSHAITMPRCHCAPTCEGMFKAGTARCRLSQCRFTMSKASLFGSQASLSDGKRGTFLVLKCLFRIAERLSSCVKASACIYDTPSWRRLSAETVCIAKVINLFKPQSLCHCFFIKILNTFCRVTIF